MDSEFITKLFAGRTKGNIFVASYANDRADAGKFPPRDMVTRRPDHIEKFIKQHDVPGRAVYVCVNTVKDRKRRKDEIAEINVLHADLDFHGILESRKVIEDTLRKLKYTPSAVVFSGHGLHCYWLLQPALGPEHIATIEGMLKQLAGVLAGDKSAAEIARVLRLPGSHNSKGGEWIEVGLVKDLCSWRTYSAGVLDKWLTSQEPLLHYKPKGKAAKPETDSEKPLNPYQQVYRDIRAEIGGLDADEELEAMTMHDVQGHGINVTHSRIIGSLIFKDKSLDEVLRFLREPTKRVFERDKWLSDGPWSEKEFNSTVKDMYQRFRKRDAAQKEDEASENEGDVSEVETASPEVGMEPALSKKKMNGSKHDLFDDGLPDEKINAWGSPVLDLFGTFAVPKLDRNMVPDLIANVAFSNAESMGSDPGALAMSLLTVASSAIATGIKIKVRPEEFNTFTQSARIWTMIIGEAGMKKSPMMEQAVEPLILIDQKLGKEFKAEKIVWDAMTPKERKEKGAEKPVRKSVIIDDFSIESAADSLLDNPQGELIFCDEIRKFFGSVTRYASAKSGITSGAEHSARGFLQACFNSAWFKLIRMSREEKSGYPSASVLGSIQPDLLHELASEAAHNDGLIQRITPVFIPKEWRYTPSKKEPSHPFFHFHELINNLHHSPLSMGALIRFSPKAQGYTDLMTEWIEKQYKIFINNSPQFASALRKWDGMFARWCLIFHMIENSNHVHAGTIKAETAKRVFRFMTDYLFDHTRVLYLRTNVSKDHEILKRIVLHAVTHKLTEMSARDLCRGSKAFNELGSRKMKDYMDGLEALNYGRVKSRGKNSRYDSHLLEMNPIIMRLYQKEGEEEKQRLAEINAGWDAAKRRKIMDQIKGDT